MNAFVKLKSKKPVGLAELKGYGKAPGELLPFANFLRGEGEGTVRSALLFGPPGMQHDRLAEQLARESNSRFMGIDCSSIRTGEEAFAIRDAFRQAEGMAPAVLFFEHLDKLFATQGKGEEPRPNGELAWKWIDLLTEWNSENRLVVAAATSRPDLLPDYQRWRGFIDHSIAIDRPDKEERGAFLAQCLEPEELAPGLSPDQIGEKAYGFSLDNLEEMVHLARNLARLKNRESLIWKDFKEAIQEIAEEYKKEWENRWKLSPEKKFEVAVHEAGHVVAAWFSPYADAPFQTSIKRRGIATLGQTNFPPCEVAGLSYEGLLTRLGIALAGKVAVELILEKECSGSHTDLATYNELCEHIVERRFPEKQALYKMEKEKQLKRIILEKTQRFLRQYRRQLKILAEQLFAEQELNKTQIAASLGEPVGPDAELPQTTLPPARYPFQGRVDVFYNHTN